MRPAVIVGLVLAWASVIACLYMEGNRISSFLGLASFILVVGGSLGAALVGVSFRELKIAMSQVLSLFVGKKLDWEGTIDNLVSMAVKARQEGVLGLERTISEQKDEIMRTGIQLIVDGADADVLQQVLDNRASVIEEQNKIGEKFMLAMGGFAPTLGIIGTVMGLVHVLGNLSNPEKLGAGIAQAFIATLYGIGFANLLYLPISNKLKVINKEKSLFMQMVCEGMFSIHAGDNSLIVKEKLSSFLIEKKKPAKEAPAEAAGDESLEQEDMEMLKSA